jgi:hypothetical protein
MVRVDEIARRYVLLVLRLARHAPELLDFYVGPSELAEAVSAEEPAPLRALHDEALVLGEVASELPDAPSAEGRRRRWLMAQLTALDAFARLLDGEEIAYVDAVETLLGVPAASEPASSFEAAHRSLDAVLAPGGSLRDRLAAHDASTRLAPEHVTDTISRIATILREHTRRDFGLPPGERVEIVAVRDRRWNAYAWYAGRFRTRIEINLDRPVSLGVAVMLAAHEAYPGHHTERSTKEARLMGELGRGEATVGCLATPDAAVSEGLADLARAMVLTDAELASLLHQVVRDTGLELDAEAVRREASVESARDVLRRALANAALALHRDRLPAEEVRQMLVVDGLYSDERVERAMSSLAHPIDRYYPFAYLTGPRLLTDWLAVNGRTGFAGLLSEQLSPDQLRAETGERPALYPADFV